MSERSKIEWTDATWNPLVAVRRDTGKVGFHCEKVSPACAHCYAETFNARNLPARGTALPYTRASRDQVDIRLDEETLRQPLHWRRPRRIFVCSMTDLFVEFVPFDLIDRVFAVMAICSQHTFQVLTKRPERMAEWFGADRFQAAARLGAVLGSAHFELHAEGAGFDWPLPNVWLGVTAEDQPRANERIPWLLRCPASVRFVSAEPLLGPIQLDVLRTGDFDSYDCLTGTRSYAGRGDAGGHETHGHAAIDWVICGGESGPHARPMHQEWARSVRDQCQAAGVAFFFKQWGKFRPTGDDQIEFSAVRRGMTKVGKKAAGRLLDGREHNEFPQLEVAVP